MKKRNVLIFIVLLMFLSPFADANEQDLGHSLNALATHEIVVNAHDWESFSIHCISGDILSGEFLITHNGELFPGDQTEYDNWLLEGIDFFVFDEENYGLWVEGSSATPLLVGLGLQEHTWSIEIPYDDVWYIVYSNDSIFIIEIEGSIAHSGLNSWFIPLIILVGIATLLSLTLILWKKK
ncbi:MAG: hypothetical protein PVJ05_15725 [Candidatus Thorarchaeota archaeon]